MPSSGGSLSPNVMGGGVGGVGGVNHMMGGGAAVNHHIGGGNILAAGSGPMPSAPNESLMYGDQNSMQQPKRARVLYDYDAANSMELSLVADEVGG